MSDQLKIQSEVVMSTEGAEGALHRVGEAAGKMADRMQREGAKAGAAVDGIGAGADKSADQFNSAEGRMAASIKRATTNFEMLGKTASEKLEFQIGQKGLDASKFEPMLAKLRQLEAANVRAGVSAGQMANNLRMVPAQMTDVVVSLASGQAPMTVLLQQGGQLKDMFGGVGAAVKAVSGYIASMVTPLTVAAAAVGGLGYAFYSGRTEADEFRKNLILTGNTSGITVDKFNRLAAAISATTGATRGASAEALTAVAASGNIAASSMERLTASAVRFERAGGQAVADTVKQFEALGKAPLEASLKLSEQTHYLTRAVYEQISALEKQGRMAEAGAVAQNAWADAIDKRTPQLVENLGLLEHAWDNLKRSASGVWDWMKDIGRDDTALEQITALKNKIAEADAGIAARSINSNRLKQQRAQWAEELAALVESNRAKEQAAKDHAARQEKDDRAVKAAAGWDALIDAQRSKRQKYSDELKKLDADRAADLIGEERYRNARAALEKKYAEKPVRQPKERHEDQTFLDQLQARTIKKDDGEPAALRAAALKLEAEGYKNVAARAEPYIQRLERIKRLHDESEVDKIVNGFDDQLQKGLRAIDMQRDMLTLTDRERDTLIQVQTLRERATEAIGKARDKFLRDDGQRNEEAYADAVSRVNKELATGIDPLQQRQDLLYDTARAFETGWTRAYRTFADEASDAAKQAGVVFNSFASNAENAMVNFTMTGKASFSQFANAVISDIARIAIRQQLITPLMSALGSFGSDAARYFNIGSASAPAPNVNTAPGFSSGTAGSGLRLPSFAVGTDYVPRDMIAQIHEGEQIVPAAYNPNRAGNVASNANRVEINVINQAGDTQVRQQSRRGSDGREIVDLIVERVAGSISNGGLVGEAIAGTFGLRRQAARSF